MKRRTLSLEEEGEEGEEEARLNPKKPSDTDNDEEPHPLTQPMTPGAQV